MKIEVYCIKYGLNTLCIPEKRSGNRVFPKWWCPNCHRYVLPDGKYHRSLWNDSIDALTIWYENRPPTY